MYSWLNPANFPPLQIPAIDQLAMHFAMDSNLLHKESDEARRQLDQLEGDESSESESEGEEEGHADADKQEVRMCTCSSKYSWYNSKISRLNDA